MGLTKSVSRNGKDGSRVSAREGWIDQEQVCIQEHSGWSRVYRIGHGYLETCQNWSNVSSGIGGIGRQCVQEGTGLGGSVWING